MKWRSLFLTASLLAGEFWGTAASEFHVEHSPAVSFEAVELLIAEALTNRFEIQALDSRIRAAALGANAVAAWRDPEIGVGPVFYDSDRIAPSQFGDIGYSIRQAFPKRNEVELLRDESKHLETGWQIEREIAVSRLRRETYSALIREAELIEVMQILRSDSEWIETLISRKEDRFKVRQSGHDELMALQNERGLLEIRLGVATNGWNSVRFRVQRLLGRPQINAEPSMRLPMPVNILAFSTPLADAVAKLSPEIRLLDNAVEWAKNTTDQARLASKPQWSIQGEARQYSGDGGFREAAFRIGISIPWVNGHAKKALIDSRTEAVMAAVAHRDEAIAALAERLHTLLLDMKGVDQAIRVHRDEIQLRRQEIAASAQSAWEVNRGSLDELLKQRRALIHEQLTIVELTARINVLMADVLYLAGAKNPGELSTVLAP